MAIEIIPKPKVKIPLWVTILLAVDIIVLLALGGTYFYFYQSSEKTESQIKEVEEKLVRTPEERSMEDNLAKISQRISNFKKVLKGHEKTSQLFPFLEGISHPNVWFTDFDFQSEKNLISLKGKASSFSVVGEQIEVLKNNDLVKEIKLEQLSMGEEGERGAEVSFALRLTFKPEVLK